MASFGVLKPRPTSRNHLLSLFFLILEFWKIPICFWKALSVFIIIIIKQYKLVFIQLIYNYVVDISWIFFAFNVYSVHFFYILSYRILFILSSSLILIIPVYIYCLIYNHTNVLIILTVFVVYQNIILL